MNQDKLLEIKDKMLRQYVSEQLNYVEFTSYMENKIRNLLFENDIRFQTISSRVKTYDSLEKKLTKNIINGVHKDIKKLNDLSGVRVIFYNDNELKKFINYLYENFEIIDNKLPENKMEYDGINITVKPKIIISKYSSYLCEIQLTTVLSHAMNEFSHNIIYKDVDELEFKDSIEYANIKEIFNNARKQIIEVMRDLDIITNRVDGIKSSSENMKMFINDNIVEKIRKIDSINELDTLIDKLISVIPILNKYEDKTKMIKDLNLVYEMTKKFSELPKESAKLLNYDTFDYKYDRLLEFLLYYQYLWIDDFKTIIGLVYIIAKKNSLLDKFDKFVERLLVNDKIESIKGKAEYYTHSCAYNTIMDNSVENYIRVKLAEYFCDLEYSNIEQVGLDQFAFSQGKLKPSKNYVKKINNVIKIVLDIFINNQSEYNMKVLLNINYNIENNQDIFSKSTIYDYFSKNYSRINLFCKNELYKSECFRKDSILYKSSFYKKIKSDKIHNLFAMMVNWFVEDIPNPSFKEKNEYRQDYLNKYISKFKESNITEIIEILNILDNYDNNEFDMITAGDFLVKIGSIENLGKVVLEKHWNKYVALGVITNDVTSLKLDNDDKINDIIKAITSTSLHNEELINYLIDYSKSSNNCEIRINILKLLFSSDNYILYEKYKQFIIDCIELYNKSQIGIMNQIYNIKNLKLIVDKYSADEIRPIIENLKYSEFNQINEFMLKDIFEKYPEELRLIIKYKIDVNSNNNFNYSFMYSNLTECSNYLNERFNNLKMIYELLNENDYYHISNYVHYLIGNYNQDLENDILKYLKENDDRITYEHTLDLLKLLDVSIKAWNIYEYIIIRVDEDDILVKTISSLLFNTGVVSGEYGISEAFNKKAEFLNSIKSKNSKLNRFIKNEIKQFKNLSIEEKERVDRRKALREKNYELQHQNNDNESKKLEE